MLQVLVPYMGGITFLDYVKELPKGKREAKGATKGGYATAQKKPVAAAAATAAATTPNGAAAAESTARALPGAEETKGGGGGGDSEADAIGDKITAKVSRYILHFCQTPIKLPPLRESGCEGNRLPSGIHKKKYPKRRDLAEEAIDQR